MPETEVVRVFTIKNKLGLHARAAAVFVRLSSRFTCDVKIIKNGYEVDGKSILGVLSLAAAKGTDVKIVTKGEGSEQAMTEIEELIESGFGEGI